MKRSGAHTFVCICVLAVGKGYTKPERKAQAYAALAWHTFMKWKQTKF